MKRTLLLLMASIAISTSSSDDYKSTPLGDSIDVASMKLLKEIYEQSADKNVVSSPLGVWTLLSLYASGSEGRSREEIMQLLGSTDYKQLSDSYSQLSERFASMDPSYLTLANKIFVSDKHSLNEGFSKTARAYKSEVDKINFEDQKTAADAINQWSSLKTRGKINAPFSESDIDPDVVVALLNVIFFQGHWYVPFNANKTKEEIFYTRRGDKRVRKPMMHLEHSLFYYEDKDMDAKMVALPYHEAKFRMIVVLPNEVDGLPRVLEKVSEKGLLGSISKMYPPRPKIDLDMPKFEIKTKINLKDILPKVGVSSIFVNGSLGIVEGQRVKVSKAIQEAFIKVDEEGAIAGAFTGFTSLVLSGPPPPIPFKVNHPFLYAILHEDIVLFAGTYTH